MYDSILLQKHSLAILNYKMAWPFFRKKDGVISLRNLQNLAWSNI